MERQAARIEDPHVPSRGGERNREEVIAAADDECAATGIERCQGSEGKGVFDDPSVHILESRLRNFMVNGREHGETLAGFKRDPDGVLIDESAIAKVAQKRGQRCQGFVRRAADLIVLLVVRNEEALQTVDPLMK